MAGSGSRPRARALGRRAVDGARSGPDWDALQREAVALLSEYIRINTTNPPGNELAGARFLKRWLEDVRAGLANDSARAWILSDRSWHAYLRNTVQITVLKASEKPNVVPAEASAEMDIRLLPGTDTAAFLASLRAAVPDPRVSWSRIFPVKTSLESPMDTELFHVIEQLARERTPGAIVVPLLVPGGTDMPWYRPLGLIAYGVDPFRIERTEQERGSHGNDERVPVAALGDGVRFIHDLLRALQ